MRLGAIIINFHTSNERYLFSIPAYGYTYGCTWQIESLFSIPAYGYGCTWQIESLTKLEESIQMSHSYPLNLLQIYISLLVWLFWCPRGDWKHDKISKESIHRSHSHSPNLLILCGIPKSWIMPINVISIYFQHWICYLAVEVPWL